MLLLIPGLVLLLACVREFYVSGKGTLAPWSPPIRLVTSGPYRFSRNPMYVAMSMLLLGWTLAFQTRGLAGWALFMIVAFHMRILLYEEPTLARLFGAEWDAYRGRVRRWVGW